MKRTDITSIRLSKKTHSQIKALRVIDDSMEDVLKKLLKSYGVDIDA